MEIVLLGIIIAIDGMAIVLALKGIADAIRASKHDMEGSSEQAKKE